jgi:hypothetical protein
MLLSGSFQQSDNDGVSWQTWPDNNGLHARAFSGGVAINADMSIFTGAQSDDRGGILSPSTVKLVDTPDYWEFYLDPGPEISTGPAILTNHSIEDIGNGSASFGAEAGQFTWSVPGSQFMDQKIVFHINKGSLSYGNGQLIVQVTCDTGSLGSGFWDLHKSNVQNPNLTNATSNPHVSISAGQTQTAIGSIGMTFQNGYFAIYLRGTGPFSGSAHISAIYWSTGPTYPNGTLNDLWLPAYIQRIKRVTTISGNVYNICFD